MTITKRVSKKGDISYRIKVSLGYSVDGKQIVQSMTYKPDPKLTPRQAEKEANRQGIIFEEKCKANSAIGRKAKFQDVADEFLELTERTQKIKLQPLRDLGYKSFDHVEMVLKVFDDTILSVGANNGGIECDDFQTKTRSRSFISACCRPNYADGSAEDVGESATVTAAAIGDAEVNEVQTWLNSRYGFDIYIDGIYGSQTRAALTKALQTELNIQFDAGLVVDGICGPLTRAAIRNISNGARGNYTKTLQGFLICNGYGTNGFDGIFGNGTERAVRDYQSDNGLVSDGIAGPATFSSLCA